VIGNLTYEYDNAGNRTKVGGSWARTGVPQSVPSTSYDANNRQLTFGDKTLSYDDNGNLQTITDASGTTIYSWNARNQLVGISGPNVNASLVYDGLGRREKKTINNSLTEFLYDGVNPVQESSGATVLANILTGLGIDELFTRTDVGGGVTSNLLTDALGSTVALADSSGAVQSENTYEPFGKSTATGAANTNPFQYTGRENDGTGLYYYRARYYHPLLQRFIRQDPIEFMSGDFNLYAYVGNNPLNLRDPMGAQAETIAAAGCLANPACAAALAGGAALTWCILDTWCRDQLKCFSQLLVDIAKCYWDACGKDPDYAWQFLKDCVADAWEDYNECVERANSRESIRQRKFKRGWPG